MRDRHTRSRSRRTSGDRVRFLRGVEHLRELRSTPKSKTRRVVTACCHTPCFLELSGAHSLSTSASHCPPDERPRLDVRTLIRSAPAVVTLPDDFRYLRGLCGRFFVKLLGAWVALGFRAPKVLASAALEACASFRARVRVPLLLL